MPYAKPLKRGGGTAFKPYTRRELCLIEDNIYTRTEGYVRAYKVLEENVLDESTLAVTLESTVELGILQIASMD